MSMVTERVRAAISPVSALVLCAIAGQALAAPAALDLVPEDAAIVVTINNVGDLLSDIEAVNALAGPNADPGIGMMAAMVRGTPGLNTEGSAAVMIPAPQIDPDSGMLGEPDMEQMVVIVPVTNFDDFTQGAEAHEGVAEFMLGGTPAFARQLDGGYALIGPAEDPVREFHAGSGRMNANLARIGASGKAIADSADVTLFANVEPFRQTMLEGMQQMKQQAAMMAAMAGGGQDVSGPMNALMEMVTGYVEDARVGIAGLSYADAGFTLDWGVQFNDGSDSAKMMDHRGDAATMISRLPKGDYYMAYAVDGRGPGFKSLMSHFKDMYASMPESAQAPWQGAWSRQIESTTGLAGVIGASPAMMQTGLLANSTSYVRTTDTNAYVSATAQAVKDSDGQSYSGMNLASTYAADADTIAGVKVDSYGVKMSLDADAQGGGMGMMGSPQQMIQMMFGPSLGPNGYIAKLDGGVVQTMSKNKVLAESAINAAKNADGLGTDDRVKSVAAHLPEGRSFEAYIAVDQVMNTAGPVAMMFGMLDKFEPVAGLEPVGMGATTIGGGGHARVFIPIDVVKKVMEMVPQDSGETEPAEEGDDEIEF